MFLDSTRFLNFLSQSKFYVEQCFQPLSPKTKIAIRVSYFKRFTLYIPCLKPVSIRPIPMMRPEMRVT